VSYDKKLIQFIKNKIVWCSIFDVISLSHIRSSIKLQMSGFDKYSLIWRPIAHTLTWYKNVVDKPHDKQINLPILLNPNAYVCPRTTQVILKNRMPLIQERDLAGWLVPRILEVLVYTENERSNFPPKPNTQKCAPNVTYKCTKHP